MRRIGGHFFPAEPAGILLQLECIGRRGFAGQPSCRGKHRLGTGRNGQHQHYHYRQSQCGHHPQYLCQHIAQTHSVIYQIGHFDMPRRLRHFYQYFHRRQQLLLGFRRRQLFGYVLAHARVQLARYLRCLFVCNQRQCGPARQSPLLLHRYDVHDRHGGLIARPEYLLDFYPLRRRQQQILDRRRQLRLLPMDGAGPQRATAEFYRSGQRYDLRCMGQWAVRNGHFAGVGL